MIALQRLPFIGVPRDEHRSSDLTPSAVTGVDLRVGLLECGLLRRLLLVPNQRLRLALAEWEQTPIDRHN